MKSTFLTTLFTLFTALFSFTQSTHHVALHVNVLGRKYETVRYYHPVEGVYTITKHDYVNTKKTAALFPNCVFIDPRTHLTEDTAVIQANSLRYVIDPAELIYVDWKMGHDSSNKTKLETFKTASNQVREKKYQQVVNDYFNPFYFSKIEVTNRQYREFITWVADSIFKETIYASDSFTDEEVFSMLNVTEKTVYFDEVWTNVDIGDREENRKYFSFKQDFHVWEEFPMDRLLPVLSEFYLKPNERWYKRREVDVTKLIYRYDTFDEAGFCAEVASLNDSSNNGKIHLHADKSKYIHRNNVSAYPDTVCWLRDSPYHYNDPFSNMYFWHPAYDNYPVVGVSWEQAKAFCHWKEQKFYAEHPEWKAVFSIDLPNAQEYEWAICHSHQTYVNSSIQDNELISDLLLDHSTGKYGQFHELLKKGLIGYTEKVYQPFDIHDKSQDRTMRKWMKKNAYIKHRSAEYSELIHTIMQMRFEQNHLPGKIRFLSNNVSEWMNEDYQKNYEKLMEAYINYNCFASPDYCENQRRVDLENKIPNDSTGKLILGANWYDERYESILGVNTGGLYAKAFRHASKSFSTVGFRYVVRLKN